jgi:hypothetical protein
MNEPSMISVVEATKEPRSAGAFELNTLPLEDEAL